MINNNNWKIIDNPEKRTISGFYQVHFYGNIRWALDFCTEKFGPPGLNAKFYRWSCTWSYYEMKHEYSNSFYHFRHKKDRDIFIEELSKWCLVSILKESYGT